MIFNSLTPRNQTEYPRYQVSDAQKIAGSNRGRFKGVGGSCPIFLSCRLALPQSCNTTLRRMFIRTAAAAGAWRCLAFWLVFAFLAIAPLSASAVDDLKPDPRSIEFFEKEVRPLLAGKCFKCHGAEAKRIRGNLRLDTRADRSRLADTVQQLQPILLILDPLIRLHRVDENDATQIGASRGGSVPASGSAVATVSLGASG